MILTASDEQSRSRITRSSRNVNRLITDQQQHRGLHSSFERSKLPQVLLVALVLQIVYHDVHSIAAFTGTLRSAAMSKIPVTTLFATPAARPSLTRIRGSIISSKPPTLQHNAYSSLSCFREGNEKMKGIRNQGTCRPPGLLASSDPSFPTINTKGTSKVYRNAKGLLASFLSSLDPYSLTTTETQLQGHISPFDKNNDAEEMSIIDTTLSTTTCIPEVNPLVTKTPSFQHSPPLYPPPLELFHTQSYVEQSKFNNKLYQTSNNDFMNDIYGELSNEVESVFDDETILDDEQQPVLDSNSVMTYDMDYDLLVLELQQEMMNVIPNDDEYTAVEEQDGIDEVSMISDRNVFDPSGTNQSLDTLSSCEIETDAPSTFTFLDRQPNTRISDVETFNTNKHVVEESLFSKLDGETIQLDEQRVDKHIHIDSFDKISGHETAVAATQITSTLADHLVANSPSATESFRAPALVVEEDRMSKFGFESTKIAGQDIEQSQLISSSWLETDQLVMPSSNSAQGVITDVSKMKIKLDYYNKVIEEEKNRWKHKKNSKTLDSSNKEAEAAPLYFLDLNPKLKDTIDYTTFTVSSPVLPDSIYNNNFLTKGISSNIDIEPLTSMSNNLKTSSTGIGRSKIMDLKTISKLQLKKLPPMLERRRTTATASTAPSIKATTTAISAHAGYQSNDTRKSYTTKRKRTDHNIMVKDVGKKKTDVIPEHRPSIQKIDIVTKKPSFSTKTQRGKLTDSVGNNKDIIESIKANERKIRNSPSSSASRDLILPSRKLLMKKTLQDKFREEERSRKQEVDSVFNSQGKFSNVSSIDTSTVTCVVEPSFITTTNSNITGIIATSSMIPDHTSTMIVDESSTVIESSTLPCCIDVATTPVDVVSIDEVVTDRVANTTVPTMDALVIHPIAANGISIEVVSSTDDATDAAVADVMVEDGFGIVSMEKKIVDFVSRQTLLKNAGKNSERLANGFSYWNTLVQDARMEYNRLGTGGYITKTQPKVDVQDVLTSSSLTRTSNLDAEMSLFSFQLKSNVDVEAIRGFAILATSLSVLRMASVAVTTMELPLTAIDFIFSTTVVPVVASYVVITKGFVGDLSRILGTITWDVLHSRPPVRMIEQGQKQKSVSSLNVLPAFEQVVDSNLKDNVILDQEEAVKATSAYLKLHGKHTTKSSNSFVEATFKGVTRWLRTAVQVGKRFVRAITDKTDEHVYATLIQRRIQERKELFQRRLLQARIKYSVVESNLKSSLHQRELLPSKAIVVQSNNDEGRRFKVEDNVHSPIAMVGSAEIDYVAISPTYDEKTLNQLHSDDFQKSPLSRKLDFAFLNRNVTSQQLPVDKSNSAFDRFVETCHLASEDLLEDVDQPTMSKNEPLLALTLEDNVQKTNCSHDVLSSCTENNEVTSTVTAIPSSTIFVNDLKFGERRRRTVIHEDEMLFRFGDDPFFQRIVQTAKDGLEFVRGLVEYNDNRLIYKNIIERRIAERRERYQRKLLHAQIHYNKNKNCNNVQPKGEISELLMVSGQSVVSQHQEIDLYPQNSIGIERTKGNIVHSSEAASLGPLVDDQTKETTTNISIALFKMFDSNIEKDSNIEEVLDIKQTPDNDDAESEAKVVEILDQPQTLNNDDAESKATVVQILDQQPTAENDVLNVTHVISSSSRNAESKETTVLQQKDDFQASSFIITTSGIDANNQTQSEPILLEHQHAAVADSESDNFPNWRNQHIIKQENVYSLDDGGNSTKMPNKEVEISAKKKESNISATYHEVTDSSPKTMMGGAWWLLESINPTTTSLDDKFESELSSPLSQELRKSHKRIKLDVSDEYLKQQGLEMIKTEDENHLDTQQVHLHNVTTFSQTSLVSELDKEYRSVSDLKLSINAYAENTERSNDVKYELQGNEKRSAINSDILDLPQQQIQHDKITFTELIHTFDSNLGNERNHRMISNDREENDIFDNVGIFNDVNTNEDKETNMINCRHSLESSQQQHHRQRYPSSDHVVLNESPDELIVYSKNKDDNDSVVDVAIDIDEYRRNVKKLIFGITGDSPSTSSTSSNTRSSNTLIMKSRLTSFVRKSSAERLAICLLSPLCYGSLSIEEAKDE